MLQIAPGQRPGAKQGAALVRSAWAERTERRRAVSSRTVLRDRALHATLAAFFTAATALLLPFFPGGWPFLLGGVVGLAALASPGAGLALALAVPILPLGNASLGVAAAYVPLALAWLVLFARDPRSGLLLAAGPLLAPLHALAFLPVVALCARGVVRRAAAAAGGVLAALATAMVMGSHVPLTGDEPPEAGLADDRPGAAFAAAFRVLADHPGLTIEALVLAVAAASAGRARSRGRNGIAAWGGGYLIAALVAPLAAGASVERLWLALGVLAATAFLAYPLAKERR
jgi:hypothetical protein